MAMTADEWARVRDVVQRSVRSGLNCTIGSHDPDGSVHLTPIGSLILTDPGHGFYFDIFNTRLAANVDADPRVSILAVDSGKPMWLRSLLGGAFVRPPGVRLTGTVGPRRPSTAGEIRRFRRVVWPLIHTRGGDLLWGRLPTVRDVRISAVLPIRTGPMTEAHPAGRLEAATIEHPEEQAGR